MTSPSFLDRISSSRNRLPILPIYSSTARPPSEYPLDELQPRPDETLNDFQPSHARGRGSGSAQPSPRRRPSPTSSIDKKMAATGRSRVIFAGPPPPIASSALINKQDFSYSGQSTRSSKFGSRGLISTSSLGFEGGLINQRPQDGGYRHDSTWRNLRRREKIIERDIQQLLDLQASGLLAGSRDGASEKSQDQESDGGESTFYSAVTSRSRISASLYVPPRSTPDGNVIPVRQPAVKKPPGLKSARVGLRKSMAALLELKAEENAHLDTALTQRRDALSYLDAVVARKDKIYAELHALEEDEQEPLGLELRELGTEYESLTDEIRLLEEKLVGMRNRRRWVKDRMEDVKNRRESGLSGYRAAGRDTDAEIRDLLRHPPIIPLDLDALQQSSDRGSGKEIEPPGGLDFLKMRPERRTAQMAKLWWEGEIALLERHKEQITEDSEALAEGSKVWLEVTKLVADFESTLRGLVKSTKQLDSQSEDSSSQDMILGQLTTMDSVVGELEKRLHLAEEKGWNLLICAIGAELEAFMEAQSLLKATLGIDDESPLLDESSHSTVRESQQDKAPHSPEERNDHDESDNEVPADLLISRLEDHEQDEPSSPEQSKGVDSQTDSESNDVPIEFLAEHASQTD
ncbi:hypothetical protein BGZ63DRAFT_60230 [Mariannaea sp. PMI_226]|nr:hypothetical protein BGZ63DRAFT_60230 [Mariannaea sp. PMI_226]